MLELDSIHNWSLSGHTVIHGVMRILWIVGTWVGVQASQCFGELVFGVPWGPDLWTTCFIQKHLRWHRIVLVVYLIFLVALIWDISTFAHTRAIGAIIVASSSIFGTISFLFDWWTIVKECGQGLHQVNLATAKVLNYLLFKLKDSIGGIKLICCALQLLLRAHLPLLESITVT